MRKIFLFGMVLALIAGGCQRCHIKKEREITPSWASIVQLAQTKYPLEGTLVQKPSGYAYVKVDDRFIHDLFPLLGAEGFEKPPYFRRDDAPGAHISVLYENEHVKAQEVGKRFTFTPKEIVTVKINKQLSYIVLKVDAPELEAMRKRYGLSPKLQNNEFHITLARRKTR